MADDRSIRDVRLEKLQRMREMGCDPFKQERFERTRTARQMLDRFEGLQGETVSYAGRVVSYRLMGKAGFAHVSDGDAKIQVYFRKDDLSETEWAMYDLLDIGDHIGVTGELFPTKTGEKSIHARSLIVLSKCLEPLPLGKTREVKDAAGIVTGTESWYELEDTEQRYRHRHLDLLANPKARKMLLDRCRITAAVRHYFDSQGFLEVETPMLQVEAGGAPGASPFTTHYKAYQMDVKLRISLELYLKRIICGDVPKVYEIGRVFRNEGVSNRHSPEFTMVEFYEAYANLEDMMTHMENCFRHVAKEVFGSDQVPLTPTLSPYVSNWRINADISKRIKIGSGRKNIWVAPLMIQEHSPEASATRELVVGDTFSITPVMGELSFLGGRCLDHQIDHNIFLEVLEESRFEFASEEATLSPGWWWLGGGSRSMLIPDTSVVPFLDFSKPWKRVDLLEQIEGHTGLNEDDLSSLEKAIGAAHAKNLVEKAKAAGGYIDLKKENNLGGLIEKLLEVFVEPTLQEPTFVVGYPIETSPLAKKDPARPGFTRRFEGYVLGREICNAFSEINDPIDQRERFEDQLRQASKGNDTAHGMDEDFIYALECGMPPTGGCGFGIDRMAMLLTGADHIREILLFPTMRPEGVRG